MKPTTQPPIITIEIESNIMPGEFLPIRGRILGRKFNGYNLPSGGWCSQEPADGSGKPAEFIIFKKLRHKRAVLISVERIRKLPK